MGLLSWCLFNCCYRCLYLLSLKMDGTYVFDKNENYEAFLKTLEIPDEYIPKLMGAKPTMVITRSGNTIKSVTKANDKEFENSITIGQPSVIKLSALEYTINVTESGNTISGSYEFIDKKGTVSVEFSPSGAVQTMTVNGVTTKRHYKRQ